MGKRNKSKRFVQQGVDSVSKHAERIPYHMTYAEAEAYKMANVKESSLGGIISDGKPNLPRCTEIC